LPGANPPESNGKESKGPRRAALTQERSRATRRKLARAALALWTERGFARGIEETTVEEIVRAAGVTKPTFYFHFAHKEDILLELGWNAADRIYEAVGKALADELSIDESLPRVLTVLARQIEQVPREAVARSVAEFYRASPIRQQGHTGFSSSFAALFRQARDAGELPASVDPTDLGNMLNALTMDSVLLWTVDRSTDLRASLAGRAQLLLAGARGVGSSDIDAGSGTRSTRRARTRQR
jgi:AcrR family transcriptional regulator